MGYAIIALSVSAALATAEPTVEPTVEASAVRPQPGVAVNAWNCGSYAPGASQIRPQAGKVPLVGKGEVERADGRAMLRLQEGARLDAPLRSGPLADGKPFAIDLELVPDGAFTGVQAGLIQAGVYQSSGIRILLNKDLRVTVEHYAGTAKEDWTFMTAPRPLEKAKRQIVRYEHDGTAGRLFLDGALEVEKPCKPPAPWSGTLSIGVAGGNRYWYSGLVGGVQVQACRVPR